MAFSSFTISKYKKYTLNDITNKINLRNKDKKNSIKIKPKTKSCGNKILIIDSIESENIAQENILSKMNIYNDNNINNNIYLNEEKKILSHKNFFESQLLSEEIFIKQKQQIKLMKEKNDKYKKNTLSKSSPNQNILSTINHKRRHNENLENIIEELNIYHNDDKNIQNQKYNSINNFIKRKKIFKEISLHLTLEKPQYFEISNIFNEFNIDFNKNEDEYENESENDIEKIPLINNNWQIVKRFKKINNCIEFSNIALRTLNEVNYNTNGVQINIDLSLVGDSEFLVFSRCFINKDYNETEIFDSTSINNESNDIFNKYTSLIKISKEKNSNKCFVSLGIFYEDENDKNKIKYETFLKRQLIDYSEIENINVTSSNSIYYYLENDLIDIKIIIIDLGNEKIDAKIFINNNKKFNHIEGKFYLPIIKRSKLLFCGIGQSILVKKLLISNIEKFEDLESVDFHKKSCTCCNIF